MVLSHGVAATVMLKKVYRALSGADPALVVGGGANSLDGDADAISFIDFLKNPMKLTKISVVGGERPFRSATVNRYTCRMSPFRAVR